MKSRLTNREKTLNENKKNQIHRHIESIIIKRTNALITLSEICSTELVVKIDLLLVDSNSFDIITKINHRAMTLTLSSRKYKFFSL